MITPNTNSAFIQIKSVYLQGFTWLNGTVAEVVEMTTQLRKELLRLNDLLLNAIDETLEQVFKEEGAEVIYSFVENKCHLKRDEISERLEEFSAGLQELLGSAAPLMENMIVKSLCARVGLEFEEREGFGFADYVKELREKWNVKA